MPYQIKKKPGGKFSVKTPHGTKSFGTTKEKALAQVRLLRAIEEGKIRGKK